MKNLFFSLIVICSLSDAQSAGVYVTDFDSFMSGANITALDNEWILAGATTPENGVAIIAASPFLTPSSGVNALRFGTGFVDSEAHLYRNYNESLVGNSVSYTQFKARFTVKDSLNTAPNRDSFAFTFRSGTENLITINLSPTLQTLTPQSNPRRIDQISYTSDFALTNLNIGSISEGISTDIDVLFTPSGINDVNFSIKFGGIEAANGTLAGAGGKVLSTFGFLWTPLNAASEGSNYLAIDDLSIVPEPSSALLISLAAMALLTRRNRD